MKASIMRSLRVVELTLLLLLLLLPSPDTEGAPPPPHNRYKTGELWLDGGSAPGTGTLLVYLNGTWGFICDDGWNRESADVACKSMGYPQALAETVEDEFGFAKYSELPILLDDVQCFGHESSLLHCRHTPIGVHDCHRREAAGVFCAPVASDGQPSTHNPTRQRITTRTTPPTQPTSPSLPPHSNDLVEHAHTQRNTNTERKRLQPQDVPVYRGQAAPLRSPARRYKIRIVNGRNLQEGRIEVKVRHGRWATLCSDTWGLRESTVACKQAGKGYAHNAIRMSFFGGEHLPKVAAGIHCTGEESSLHECEHEQFGELVSCPRDDLVAGVICTDALPDLTPNATLVQQSAYLEDRPLVFLQCAMEENCAASSAFRIRQELTDWHYHARRLLRFSSSTWNIGTADFRPQRRKEDWDWHLCHMHYHSMDVFAHYDLLAADGGNRVAEGHKASFCLEDVQCSAGVEKKYACKGFGDQGISVGCADDYLHDIDCQWIDVTDVSPGYYSFRMHINPEYQVAELDYSNNAVHCDLYYSGASVHLSNCETGRPTL